MQDNYISRMPLWRQPVLWAASATALLIVGGVDWMIYSTEELDEQLNRDAAVAGHRGRQAEREHAHTESAAQDARPRESQGGGNSCPSPDEEDKSTTAQSDVKSARRADAVFSPRRAEPTAVSSQQPPSSRSAEPLVVATAANSPPPGVPQKVQPQATEAAPPPPPSKRAAPHPPACLKCEENGETNEVRFDNGTVLLDTYGDAAKTN